MPCNYVHTELGYTEDTVHEECNPDLAAQKEYLGTYNAITYYNHEVINVEKFGEESIERFSVVTA